MTFFPELDFHHRDVCQPKAGRSPGDPLSSLRLSESRTMLTPRLWWSLTLIYCCSASPAPTSLREIVTELLQSRKWAQVLEISRKVYFIHHVVGQISCVQRKAGESVDWRKNVLFLFKNTIKTFWHASTLEWCHMIVTVHIALITFTHLWRCEVRWRAWVKRGHTLTCDVTTSVSSGLNTLLMASKWFPNTAIKSRSCV